MYLLFFAFFFLHFFSILTHKISPCRKKYLYNAVFDERTVILSDQLSARFFQQRPELWLFLKKFIRMFHDFINWERTSLWSISSSVVSAAFWCWMSCVISSEFLEMLTIWDQFSRNFDLPFQNNPDVAEVRLIISSLASCWIRSSVTTLLSLVKEPQVEELYCIHCTCRSAHLSWFCCLNAVFRSLYVCNWSMYGVWHEVFNLLAWIIEFEFIVFSPAVPFWSWIIEF